MKPLHGNCAPRTLPTGWSVVSRDTKPEQVKTKRRKATKAPKRPVGQTQAYTFGGPSGCELLSPLTAQIVTQTVAAAHEDITVGAAAGRLAVRLVNGAFNLAAIEEIERFADRLAAGNG